MASPYETTRLDMIRYLATFNLDDAAETAEMLQVADSQVAWLEVGERHLEAAALARLEMDLDAMLARETGLNLREVI